MTVLMPRLFGDLSGWLGQDYPVRDHLIRFEELLTGRDYTLRAELPGVDPAKDIQLTLADGVLTVRAEREDRSAARHRTEFHYGTFQRSVRLPFTADEEQVTAKYGNGILEITVPLHETDPGGRMIAITTE